jgi:hypothetical protein
MASNYSELRCFSIERVNQNLYKIDKFITYALVVQPKVHSRTYDHKILEKAVIVTIVIQIFPTKTALFVDRGVNCHQWPIIVKFHMKMIM